MPAPERRIRAAPGATGMNQRAEVQQFEGLLLADLLADDDALERLACAPMWSSVRPIRHVPLACHTPPTWVRR